MKTKVKKLSKTSMERIQHLKQYFVPADQYLDQIGFDKRLEEGRFFSDSELKQILRDNFERYVKGDVSQDFVIDLGALLYQEAIVGEGDETLLSVTCALDDLVNKTSISSGNVSVEEKDRLLREALEALRKDQQKQAFN